MKITDLYDENEKARPFLIDTDALRRKIEYGLYSIMIIFCVIYGFWFYKISLRIPAKQHFVCNDSICKIIKLNKKDVELSTIDMNRNDINYNIVQHVIYDPSYPINATNRKAILSEDTPIVYRHLHSARCKLGFRAYFLPVHVVHEYYIKIFPKKEYLIMNKDMTKLENHALAYILGPVGSEKYAKEISEKLNNTIHTNENINIEIKHGKSWSYR